MTSFLQRALNTHPSGVVACSAFWLLHGWCHSKLLPSRRILCAPSNCAPYHVISSKDPTAQQRPLLVLLLLLNTYHYRKNLQYTYISVADSGMLSGMLVSLLSLQSTTPSMQRHWRGHMFSRMHSLFRCRS